MDLSTADPLIGQLLDRRYRIEARIARGGMATVYTATDTRLDRPVALKVMHATLAEDDEFVERFRREAKAAAKLSHPSVVAVYDQGEDAGYVYLVMEHVPGRTLRHLLGEHGRIDPATALTIIEGLLEALGAAHDAGIVHRDVKPENVLITDDFRVKVADFGLARAIEATHQTLAGGTLIGTVAYLAPEQVVTGAADARTDLYAAGVVLFEMLTGGPPFSGDTPLAVAYRHVNEDVPAPSSVASGVPRALDDVVLAATRRDAEGRYADARTMLSAVRRARARVGDRETTVIPLDDAPTIVTQLPASFTPPAPPKAEPKNAEPKQAGPKPTPPLPSEAAVERRRKRKRRVVVAAVTSFVLAVAAVAGWYLGSGRYAETPALTKLTLQAAQAKARTEGFTLRQGAAVFSDTVPAGQVAGQDPEAGERVRDGATITIFLSKGVELVAMPDVSGKTERQARDLIAAARLKTGAVAREYHDSIAEGQVISASQPRGARLRPDTVVTLVVSRGRPPVDVPNLVGKQWREAEQLLKAAGLKHTRTLEYSETAPEGEVIRQSPDPGTSVREGSTVQVVLSQGPPLVEVPNVIGKARDDAQRIIRSAGLVPRFLDFPGRRGRSVVDQYPRPGTRVRKGSTVDLYMF